MKKTIWIFCVILLAGLVPRLAAQDVPYRGIDRGALYVLGAEDELLIPVNVWGFVQRPGQYWVPNNTDLMSLLSFAGGPAESGKISKIRVVRKDAGIKPFNVNIAKYLDTGDSSLIPMLKPGDTVVVKGTTFYWVSKFFEFVSRLSVLAQIVYFIALSNQYLTN